MEPIKGCWLLLHTRPRQERVAERHLRRQGFRVYLPLALDPLQRGHAGPEPLFPRYLFLHAHPGADNLAPVRSTRGVRGLVNFGSGPTPVSDSVVDSIMHRTDPVSGCVTLDSPALCEGDRVVVLNGALQGLQAVFSQPCGERRAFLLIELMGRSIDVEVDRSDLRRVG